MTRGVATALPQPKGEVAFGPDDPTQQYVERDRILSGMGEGYVLLDRDFRVLIINAKALGLETRPASEIVGGRLGDIWPGLEEAEPGRLFRKTMEDRVPVTFDNHYTWPDGRSGWFEVRAFPAPEGLAIFYRDITARREAEMQLREARAAAEALAAEQATVLRQLAEGVIVTDTAGRISIVNKAAADIHGVERLDVVPKDYSATYHLFTEDGDPYDPLSLPLARAVRGETVKDERWRIRRPDGADVLAIGSAQPLFDPEGRQVGAVLTLRDDTARESAERALRELADTLDQRVRERTRQLDTAKHEAEAARRQAETANEAKSEFLAAMSHEIRTPLHGVLGIADLLLDTELTDDQRRKLVRLQSAGASLLTIVNDILDFSRIEAGRVELQVEPFLLASLVDEALSIVRESAEVKGLCLSVEAAPGLPSELIGDEGRLRQVLLNLLNNAIKFTPAGAVTLKVERLDEGNPIAALRLAVVDTGIGIPVDKMHCLFERFSQIDGSMRRQYGGTGLGLAISKQLVTLMGGTIDVTSEEGKGSTFAIRIALPVADHPSAAPGAPAVSAAPQAGSGARILVVDDVELNIEIVRALLEKAGHTVEAVLDGAEAVEAVRGTSYDLVLMDVQMPGTDGLTATREIRALPAPASGTPIIAMTAAVLPHQRGAFHAAGMDDHIGKPFEREELYAAIARWRHGR